MNIRPLVKVTNVKISYWTHGKWIAEILWKWVKLFLFFLQPATVLQAMNLFCCLIISETKKLQYWTKPDRLKVTSDPYEVAISLP